MITPEAMREMADRLDDVDMTPDRLASRYFWYGCAGLILWGVWRMF